MPLLVSTDGYVLKTRSEDIPIQKRMSFGVKVIKLTANAAVKQAFSVDEDETVTINGKEIAVKDLREQNRNTRGQRLFK